jgi:hypothetical protein
MIYYFVDEGASIKWEYIMCENPTMAIFAVKEAQPITFPSFHMSSHLLDIMFTTHKYPRIKWSWQPSDPTIHV